MLFNVLQLYYCSTCNQTTKLFPPGAFSFQANYYWLSYYRYYSIILSNRYIFSNTPLFCLVISKVVVFSLLTHNLKQKSSLKGLDSKHITNRKRQANGSKVKSRMSNTTEAKATERCCTYTWTWGMQCNAEIKAKRSIRYKDGLFALERCRSPTNDGHDGMLYVEFNVAMIY